MTRIGYYDGEDSDGDRAMVVDAHQERVERMERMLDVREDDVVIGDMFDVLRVENRRPRWREAVVVDLHDSRSFEVLMHFLFTPESEDEWVNLREDERVAPYGTFTFVPEAGAFDVQRGQLVDVFDHHPANETFARAEIKAVHRDKIRVAFLDRNAEDWTGIQMLRAFGSHTSSPTHQDNAAREEYVRSHPHVKRENIERMARLFHGRGGPVTTYEGKENEEPSRKRRERGIMARGDPRFSRYRDALEDQGLRLVEIVGDGNCLFRAVSHQVYGTQAHHRIVRQACMDYMESESAYFQPFVVGDGAAFRRYIDNKRRDGVWGDDIEIQAMCEIYDRPAQVMAFDPRHGARQLRTFHETDEERHREPMLLSFYGGGHYDSIEGPHFEVALLSTTPGELGMVENGRVALSRARRAGQTEAELRSQLTRTERSEQVVLDNAIKHSREQYMSVSNQDLENALDESLRSAERAEEVMLQNAVHASVAAPGEEVQTLLASDLAATEQEALEQALRLSEQEARGHGDAPDQAQQSALEESLVREAMRQSQGLAADDVDDGEIQRAIELSLQDGR